MKLPCLLAACLFVMPLTLSALDDPMLKAIEDATAQEYVESYNEMINNGKLDPEPNQGAGEPGSLERRLWRSGYDSALLELLDPEKAREAKDPGLVRPWAPGIKIHYAFGYSEGQKAACEVARELFMKIYARRIGEFDDSLAREKREKARSEAAEGRK